MSVCIFVLHQQMENPACLSLGEFSSLKKQSNTFSSLQPFLLLLTILHWKEKEMFC